MLNRHNVLVAIFIKLRSLIVKPSFRENASGHEMYYYACAIFDGNIYRNVTVSAYITPVSSVFRVGCSTIMSYHPISDIRVLSRHKDPRRKFHYFRLFFLSREKKEHPPLSIRDVLSVIMKEILLFKGSPRGMSSTDSQKRARKCHQ